MKLILSLTALLIGLATADPRPPNIVLILADDLGYGDLHSYNPDSKIPTPHLDQLAAQGIRFTDAHSPSTVCTPTRYSILTGRMAFRTGNRSIFTGAGGPNMIEQGRLTLPQMLRNQGYTTALIGKWHVGLTFLDSAGKPIHDDSPDAIKRIDYSRPIPDAPIHRGFDHFFGTACCPTTDWLYAFIQNDRIPNPPTRPLDKSNFPKNPYTQDFRPGLIAPDFDIQEIDMIFLNKSLKFLETHHTQNPGKPFFLFHSAQAVHLPSIPGKDFQGKTNAGPHGDFIAQFDHIVGTIVKKIDDLGLTQNTLILLTSDNGPEVPTVIQMRKDHQHDGAKPWRGMKRDQWEGGHRVPLIARWPGTIAPNLVHQTISLTDLMATAAAITGADLPRNAAEDSFNLLPLLLGESDKPIRPFTLHQTWTLDLAIRRGHWKYLDHPGSGGNRYLPNSPLAPYILPETAPDAPSQLYNLQKDPGETQNLYHQHPEIVIQLKTLLDQTKSSGRSTP